MEEEAVRKVANCEKAGVKWHTAEALMAALERERASAGVIPRRRGSAWIRTDETDDEVA